MTSRELIARWAEQWRPPERLTLSQWAERHFVLSPEYSAVSGQLIRLYGWQREPLDAFTDPRVQTIVLMTGIQMIKTLLQQIALAYIIAKDPGPTLFSQYKETDVEQFSRDRLTPMIRDMEVLAERVQDAAKNKSSANTIAYKQFSGGSLSLIGSLSPANWARRSIRYLFCDEIDKYESLKVGDPIKMGLGRTVTYRSRRKIILTCSPTIKGHSRIERFYNQSDQRKPWVPCHACGEYQVLKWAQVKFDKFDAAGARLPDDARAATARYECAFCGARWNDLQRWAACEYNRLQWRASAPFARTAGFWINHLYSPWRTLEDIVAEYLKVKRSGSMVELQTFYNEVLAELWEEKGDAPDDQRIWERRERYEHFSDGHGDLPWNERARVPARGLFLTAAVDVQKNPPRLEVGVKAWGRDKEAWHLGYWVFAGDVSTADGAPWKLLARLLEQSFPHAHGVSLPIFAMAIDTGYAAGTVYEFALRYPRPAHNEATGSRVVQPRTVIPTAGASDWHRVIASVSKTDAARKRQNVRIWKVGGQRVKSELFGYLNLNMPDGYRACPGYQHYPDYGRAWFAGLCSEQVLEARNGSERYYDIIPGHERNEPLDTEVYNRLAAELMGISRYGERQWRKLELAVGIQEFAAAPVIPEPVLAPQTVMAAQPPQAPAPVTVTPRPLPSASRRRAFGRFSL